MKSYKQFINEATFNLNTDVYYLYNRFYNKFITKINNNKWDGIFPKIQYTDSSVLTSPDSIKAHEINPINIKFHDYTENGNFYNPSKSHINFYINKNALSLLIDKGFNLKKIAPNLGNMKLPFLDDLSEKRIKGIIYHELSHWVDDSLHNRHLKKLTLRSHETDRNIMFVGNKGTQSTYYEINAQIHALKQMKSQVPLKIWNNWTWNDLELNSSAIHTMSILNKKSGDFFTWRRKLLKRMSRENLLGKRMKLI